MDENLTLMDAMESTVSYMGSLEQQHVLVFLNSCLFI